MQDATAHVPRPRPCHLRPLTRTGRALSGDNDGDRHATPRADMVALDGFPSARGIGTRRTKDIVRSPSPPRCGGFGFAFDGGDLAMIGSMQKIAAALASAAGKIRLTSRFDARPDIIAGSPDRRIAGSPDRRIAGSPDRRIAGSPDRRIAGSPGRRVAGSPGRRVAGSPGRRVAGSPNLRPWVGGECVRRMAALAPVSRIPV